MRHPLERRTRQFRRLVRFSSGRLLDSAFASREVDAEHFALWTAALMAVPPFFYVVQTTSRYPWLLHRRPELLEQVVLGDRLFFIMWAMLAAMVLAARTWSALSPDRTDQQILGVLPVRASTVAAARLTASLAMVAVYMAAVTVPAAAVYALGGTVDASLGPMPGVFAGHVVAGGAAGLFTFAALVALRGLLVLVAGAAAAARTAVAVQLVTGVLLVKTFLFLPGLLPAIVEASRASVGQPTWIAPAWFLGLQALFAGPASAELQPIGASAVAGVAAAVAAAAGLVILPAALNARRALEARSGERTGTLPARLVGMARGALRTEPSRAILGFILTTLARSQRHLLIVATYLGLGLAVAGTRPLSASLRGRPVVVDVPTDYLLSVPLILTFFLVAGLHAAFKVPSEIGANWAFRLSRRAGSAASLAAVRAAVLLIAVGPVSVATLAAGVWLWGGGTAAAVATMHAGSGIALCELVLRGRRSLPFTRAHAPSTETMRTGLPLFVVALAVFAFALDGVQVAALRSTTGPAIYVASMLVVAAGALVAGRMRGQPAELSFEAPRDRIEPLNLSGALG